MTSTTAAVPDGATTFIAGTGIDTVSYGLRTAGVRVALDNIANDGGSGGAEGDEGSDTVNARDGISGNDTARGGPGTDICRTDPGDARSGCES
jgi:hypothetical protein